METSFALTDKLFDQVIGEQVAANRFMERGNLAEFRGDKAPDLFRESHQHMLRSLEAIDAALKDYDVLLQMIEKDPGLPVFRRTMQKLLFQAGQFERISPRSGARYSDLGVAPSVRKKRVQTGFKDLAGILRAQQEDLRVLRELTAEVTKSFQDILPLTDRGEFVRSMLSGRWAFGDKYEEMIEARSTFSHFYTRSCMVSIQAVMQTYPAGFDFLQRS